MNRNRADDILQETEDGLEDAMRLLGLRSLPTEQLVAIAKYAIRSNVVTIAELQEVQDASMKISEGI